MCWERGEEPLAERRVRHKHGQESGSETWEGPHKQDRPGAQRVSGRTFSAGMCCTIRAEWIWMDWRWWILRMEKTETST